MLLNVIFRCLEILVYFFLAILKTNLFSHHLFICNFILNLDFKRFSVISISKTARQNSF